jgi:outer membrane lipoprotein-sorting protein
MKHKHLMLTGSLWLCMLTLFGQSNKFRPMTEKEKTAFITEMQAASKTTNSLQCNFIQKKEMSMLAEASVSKGMMYFKAPDAIRWEYTSPQAFAFVMNQGQSVVKNNKGTTAMDAQSSKMIKSMTEMILGMINGKGLMDNKNFSAEYYVNQTQTQIKLIPKNARIKMMFSSINVIVDKKNYLAQQIEMKESGGDVTTITLSNIKRNASISDEKFTVK